MLKSQVNKIKYQEGLDIHRVNFRGELWTHCVNELHRMWEVPQRDPPIFPGPQPISIERRHFPKLKKNKYLICEKTDGIRHALVCTTWKDTKVAVLIDRALEMFLVRNKFNNDVYNGTVIDLELIFVELKWTALMYDVIYIKGIDVKSKHLDERLSHAGEMAKSLRKLKTDTVLFASKPMYTRNDFDQVLEGTKGHKTDGLIFTPVVEPVRVGTHNTMFKWKPREKNTIDFMVKRTPKVIRLFIQERGTLMFESEINVQDIDPEWNNRLVNNTIVECGFDNGIPVPILIRTDKNHPNNRKTFYRTLTNIAENIQMNEFKTMFKSKIVAAE